MKLRELLQQMQQVQQQIGASTPYICGGTPRDKFMGRLDNVADIDITTGDKTVDYLSQEFNLVLRKKYNVTRKSMEDGHSTIFIGNLKVDFSSNFIVPNINQYLQKMGIINPTDMQREMFSRDFTCNALLLTIDLKKVLDPTKRGEQDIKNKVIRTCLDPAVTLTSNRNRVIRSIYLACKLGFEIDPAIVDFIRKNPQVAKISTEKVTNEKLNQAFEKDPDKAARLITQMNLWQQIPINEKVQPYYMKNVKNKVAYFQGGGGVNEPTPGEKKYKSDSAIVVQPRFEEPFYHNYDLYAIPGMEHIGPGTGWHGLQNYKSVKDFLEDRRKRLKPRYVADDSWQLDDGDRSKKNPNIEARVALLNRIIKVATGNHFKITCNNCGAISQCRCPSYFHQSEPQLIKFIDHCTMCVKKATPNYEPGTGLYENMDKYHSTKEFIDHPPKGQKAFFADDNSAGDYMLPPKEHGTKIYDWKNSPYQGIPKKPKCDDNDIDFPIDDQVSPIESDSGSSYLDSIPISYMENYTAEPDQDGKGEDSLDFGYDLTNEDEPIGRFEDDEHLDKMEKKYLRPAETEIYGLPDGVDSEAKDADQTISTENPDYGITDSGRQMYEDKWNI